MAPDYVIGRPLYTKLWETLTVDVFVNDMGSKGRAHKMEGVNIFLFIPLQTPATNLFLIILIGCTSKKYNESL